MVYLVFFFLMVFGFLEKNQKIKKTWFLPTLAVIHKTTIMLWQNVAYGLLTNGHILP